MWDESEKNLTTISYAETYLIEMPEKQVSNKVISSSSSSNSSKSIMLITP